MIIDSVPWKRISRAVVVGVALLLVIFGSLLYWEQRKVKLNWAEEVVLGDQKTAVVEFRGRYKKVWYPDSPMGYWLNDVTVSVKAAGSADATPPWRGHLRPVLIDRHPTTGDWVIVVGFNFCHEWHAMGKPIPQYLEYRQQGQSWVRFPISEGFVGRDANILFADPSMESFLRANDFKLGAKSKAPLLIHPRRPEALRSIAANYRGNC
jgi:hypothetical protein